MRRWLAQPMPTTGGQRGRGGVGRSWLCRARLVLCYAIASTVYANTSYGWPGTGWVPAASRPPTASTARGIRRAAQRCRAARPNGAQLLGATGLSPRSRLRRRASLRACSASRLARSLLRARARAPLLSALRSFAPASTGTNLSVLAGLDQLLAAARPSGRCRPTTNSTHYTLPS